MPTLIHAILTRINAILTPSNADQALLQKDLKPPCKPDPALDVLSPENNPVAQRLKGIPVSMPKKKVSIGEAAAGGGKEEGKKQTKNYAKMAREP